MVDQEANKKQGMLRRLFGFIGTVVNGIRTLIGVVFIGFLLLMLTGLFADDIQPMPDSGALYLAPSGVLVDQKTTIDPLGEILSETSQQDSETLVRDIVEAVNAAANDRRITHLVLDTDYMAGASLSKLEEISVALLQFKKSGKPIIAVADNLSQSQYYLAAHADEILLNPLGSVMITGFGSNRSFFKDALDKLKINIHIFRVGKFKSAVEPYIGNSMSPESRQETTTLLTELWQFYGSQVEQLRGLPAGTIHSYADNLHSNLKATFGNASALAKEQDLIDQIATRTEMHSYLNEMIASTDGYFNHIGLKGYLNHVRLGKFTSAEAQRQKIALIVAAGNIVDGEQPEGTVGGDTLAGIFADVRDNDDIKAVVLRIDSPGGSAFASEVIRDAMAATREQGIPIVVSMGSYAASGGYWIATEADRVLAMPTTITGSIGVYGVIPTMEDSLAALGVYSDAVNTTANASLLQLNRPMTEQAKIIFQSSVDNVYSRFITLVANARNSTPKAVHEIAQGQVWTGQKALQLGLIDQLGDLNDAIVEAAELADLSEYSVTYQRKPLTFYEQFLAEINGNIRASLAGLGVNIEQASWLPDSLRQQAVSLLKPFALLDQLTDPRGVYLYCDDCPSQ
ncbi:MAG: signal peptide peptidase SppA [Porticoccaceae bacterium]|nr:signal peptide peptidase SppA [Porticoccaceae bacterium]